MSHAPEPYMAPIGPHAGSSGVHHVHGTRLWKLLVGGAGAMALGALTVASCPMRGQAGPDGGETIVETVAGAPTTTSVLAASSSTSDSTGGTGAVTLTSGELQSRERQSRELQSREPRRLYSPKPVPFETAEGAVPVAGHASHADNDPNNRSSLADSAGSRAAARLVDETVRAWSASPSKASGDGGGW